MKDQSIPNWIKKIGRFYVRYNLVIGLLLTILGLYLTIYPPRRDARLVINYSEFDLVKRNDANENLKIFFKGSDIDKEKLNLKVYSVKLENKGKTAVSIADYDPRIPFGIEVKNGFITGFDMLPIKGGDSYLLNNLFANKIEDSTRILFNKVIIKPHQFIKLKFTVLHKDSIKPQIIPIGKLSSSDIELVNGDDEEETDWVEVIKFFLFLILGIWLVPKIFGLFGKLGNYTLGLIRRKIILNKYEHHFDNHNKIQRTIVKLYSELGKKSFIEIVGILKNESNRDRLFEEEKYNERVIERFNLLIKEKKIDAGNTKSDIEYGSDLLFAIELLEEVGLIEVNANEKISIEDSLLDEMEFVLEILE